MRVPSALVAAVATAGLLAACAAPAPAPKPAAPAATQQDFAALAAKLHSPRLMARVLLGQARSEHDAKRAVYAGLLALRGNDFDLARQAADLAHKLDPTSAVPYEIRLRAELSAGDIDAARKSAARALHLGGADALASIMHGPLDPWFGYAVVRPLARAHPKDADLTLLLARAALGAGDDAAALAAARRAAAAGADAQTATLVAIEAEWNLGRHKTALARGAKALAANAHDIGLRVFFAGLLAQAGQRARSREVLGDAHALAPDDPHVLFGYAVLDAAEGRIAAARARLTAVLERGGDTAGAYHLLGSLAADEHDWGQAFGWYSAVEDGDFLGSSGVAAAFALQQWKGLKIAQRYLDRLLKAAPGLAPTWLSTEATLLDQAGQTGKAYALVSHAVRQYPVVRPLRYQHALLADKLDKAAIALDTLQRLVREEPQNPEYLNAYGYTLTEHTHRYREAYDYIKRALAADPDNGAILDSMGWVLFHLGQPAKAAGYLRRAWAQTSDTEVAEHLVKVCIALGRTAEASKVLASALAKAPGNGTLIRLQQRLKQ